MRFISNNTVFIAGLVFVGGLVALGQRFDSPHSAGLLSAMATSSLSTSVQTASETSSAVAPPAESATTSVGTQSTVSLPTTKLGPPPVIRAGDGGEGRSDD